MPSVLKLVDVVIESGPSGLLSPGFELPPYRIVKLLASGGMGEVYLAVHQTLGRQVAIKVLREHTVRDADLVRRFFIEARAANAINHENIVEVHDFVCDPDRTYFVMELLAGGDLAKSRDQRGPFPVVETLAIAAQICTALQAAHEKGIIHRDLKPENVVLIERAGVKNFVKLLDFGIAKLSGEGFADAPGTVAGLIIGTPEYMSPEQASGRLVDVRTDVYSLGVLLYWMLSDRLPFRASAFDKLLMIRLTQDPPPLPATSSGGEPISGPLARTVMRCLARDPANRFQTMAELRAALEKVRQETPGDTERHIVPVPRKKRRIGVALAVVAAVIVGGGLAWWSVEHRRADPIAKVSTDSEAGLPKITPIRPKESKEAGERPTRHGKSSGAGSGAAKGGEAAAKAIGGFLRGFGNALGQ